MNREKTRPSIASANPAAPNGHGGLIVWFTGLSGAGKTTLAKAVERGLLERGFRTFIIDGDVLRAGLCSDLGFSEADRHENIRRAGAVAAMMAQAGSICLAALISPFREDRDKARALAPSGCFLEVFVNAPLAVCEQRDVKGLYRRARANEIPNFTGVSSPYEPPKSPEVEVHTDLLTVEQSAVLVLEAVEERLRVLSISV